ncbi:E3 ubiquitin-protein ligase TRIM11-like [Megalops cyprinoides]|uniref:E3 ubiquitin-protein ligase TRIM11-like n=1 Tax=Megalops cyprinoides TaxID=118141 RepID=UPI0018646D15|nr:E3 ubiquitin-protein ligase TRIM11-like [Megalops cyprinoides]
MAASADAGGLPGEVPCGVCRDLLPASPSLPCGHTLCMACVREARGQQADGRFRCPQCPEESGQVACDCCADGHTAAQKTCLRCEVSLCADHLQPHLQRPAFRSHLLVRPLADLSRRRCPEHDELFRHYCTDEGVYVCADCVLEGKHAEHRVRRLRSLEGDLRGILQERVQKAEEKLRESERILKEQKEADHTLADASSADELQVERLGVSLQAQVERLVGALRESAQRESRLAQVRLQQDQGQVERDLSHTKDLHDHLRSLLAESDPFLLIWAFQLENKTMSSDLDTPLFNPLPFTLDRKCALETVESELRHFLSETLKSLNRLKRQFSSSPLTLDWNSAHPLLSVSDDRRTAVRVRDRLPCPAHPERFDHWAQVLTAQSFTSGTHYWELEAEGYWDIAVTYRSIGRKGKEGTAFGNNKLSWSLTRQAGKRLAVWHNRRKTRLAQRMAGTRVGVSLDYSAGTITFWEAGPALVHLHTFSTTFTQPVCLGFGLYKAQLHSRVTIVSV